MYITMLTLSSFCPCAGSVRFAQVQSGMIQPPVGLHDQDEPTDVRLQRDSEQGGHHGLG